MGKNKLKFDIKTHTYTVGDTRLTSVTQFIKKFFNEFDTKKISKYVAKARRNKGEKGPKGKPITAWNVRKEWKNSADEGTHIHEQIEEYILGKGYNMKVQDVHKKSMQGINYFTKEMERLSHAQPKTELRLYSETLGIAGTIDLSIIHEQWDEDDCRNVVSLYDWKTNKQIRTTSYKKSPHPLMKNEVDCSMTHYILQLSLYAYILETEYDMEIDELVIVHLTEGTATPYKVKYRKELIEEMLKWK